MLVFRCLQETQGIKSEFQGDIQVKDKNLGAINTKMAGERMAWFKKWIERRKEGKRRRVSNLIKA